MAFTATYNQQKPMSISSITSPLNEIPSTLSPSTTSSPYQHHNNYKSHHLISFVHYTNTIDPKKASSTVDSFPSDKKQHQQQRPPPSFSYSSSELSSLSSIHTASGIERSPSPTLPTSKINNQSSEEENNNNNHNRAPSPNCQFSSTSIVNSPLSLQERRQRNKTASAKYRAKKNQQHQGMRAMIHSMTKENDLLLRQLEQAKSENRQLKSTCDKLRSKMMAEKMFKKMLYQHQQQPSEENHHHNHAVLQTPPEDEDDTDSFSNNEDNVRNESDKQNLA